MNFHALHLVISGVPTKKEYIKRRPNARYKRKSHWSGVNENSPEKKKTINSEQMLKSPRTLVILLLYFLGVRR